MTGEGAPDRATERRVRRWSLVAVAVLLPLAFVRVGWASVGDYMANNELRLVRAASDGTATYAGATWRLSHLKIYADDPDPELRTPPDRALVMVRLKAKLARDAGDGLYACRLTLADAAGRRWGPSGISLPLRLRRKIEPGGDSPPSCASVALAQPKAGAEVEFGEIFVVPRDALPTLDVRFSARAGRPDALAFGAPKE